MAKKLTESVNPDDKCKALASKISKAVDALNELLKIAATDEYDGMTAKPEVYVGTRRNPKEQPPRLVKVEMVRNVSL